MRELHCSLENSEDRSIKGFQRQGQKGTFGKRRTQALLVVLVSVSVFSCESGTMAEFQLSVTHKTLIEWGEAASMLPSRQLMLLLLSHSPLCLLLFGPLRSWPTLFSALLASSSSLHDIVLALYLPTTAAHWRGEVKLRPHSSWLATLSRLLPPVDLHQLARLCHLLLTFLLTLRRQSQTSSAPPHQQLPPVSSRSLVSTGDDRILF